MNIILASRLDLLDALRSGSRRWASCKFGINGDHSVKH